MLSPFNRPVPIGELAALTGALLWAIASVLYGRVGQRIPALLLNFLKGAIAITLLVLTLLSQRVLFPPVAATVVGGLWLSGVVGIGLGDTAYLMSLNQLGVRRALLLETLAPPIAAILAGLTLGEHLSRGAIAGIGITMLGVGWVILERTPTATLAPPLNRMGLVWGLLAELAQGSGAVLSRQALADDAMTPLWSSLIRLVGGEMILVVLLIMNRFRGQTGGAIAWTQRGITAIALAAFGGTYLGIWCQQTALKFAPTGIAQTLLATSPLFVLPIVALLGEKITLRSLLGVAIALVGIALLFNS
ncbi:MAG: DMT family transporter [Spirulinaceae cyanobacterium]